MSSPTQRSLLHPVTASLALTLALCLPAIQAQSQAMCTAPTPYQSANNLYNTWDWVPAEQLPTTCSIARGCAGRYVPPPRHWPDSHLNPNDAPWRGDADTSLIENGDVLLIGDVFATKGYLSIEASQAELDHHTNEWLLTGPVVIRDPDMLVRGNMATINADTGLGFIESARLLLYDKNIRGTALYAERTSETVWNMDQASYTQCTPDDQSWHLTSKHLVLNEASGVGVAKHAKLYLGNIPIAYTPYFSFPLDDRRKSGWLNPSLSTSNRNGLDVTIPYYFNSAPNFDATVAPRIIQKRGAMAETEARYLNRYGHLNLSGGYLPHDNETDTNRWIGHAIGNVRYHDWSGKLNFTQVSDNNYFRDLDITNFTIKRAAHLKQDISATYRKPLWESHLQAVQYQTIEDGVSKPYKRLPQLTIKHRTTASNFALEPIGLTQWTYFEHDDPDDNPTGQRLYAEGGFRFPMYWSYGFIVPTTKVMHVNYKLDNIIDSDDSTPSTTVPLGALDTGLFFDRDVNVGKHAFLQTLEPRLYYVYSPNKNQNDQPTFDTGLLNFSYNQLFRDTRFTGHDRLGDANRLSVAMTSRLIESSTGIDVLTMQIGQIIYLEDRNVQLSNNKTDPSSDRSTSDIALGLQYRPSNQLGFTSSLIWDPNQRNTNEGGFSFHWLTPGKALYNLGYRFRRDGEKFAGTTARDLSQIDTSLALPIGNHWTLVGRYQYDLEQRYALEEMVGVEYERCCYLVRLVYQRTVDDEEYNPTTQKIEAQRDTAVLLEFELKGLGRGGSKALKLIRQSIWGYDELY